MTQNILTIIIKVKDGRVDSLENCLRSDMNPEEVTGHKKLKCKEAMPFDKLKGLHFASLAVLRDDTSVEGERIEPCLMLEATFDGEASDFIDDLIELPGGGLDKILEHCEGYPKWQRVRDPGSQDKDDPGSQAQLKPILRQYLLDHDVGYDTFFSGHPGQSVGQVLGEDTLRKRILKFARAALRQPAALALGLRNIQTRIRRDIVRAGPRPNAPDLRWVEETPTVPFLVRYGRQSVKGIAALALFVLACTILYVIDFKVGILRDCYQDPMHLRTLCSRTELVDANSSVLHRLLMAVVTFPVHVISCISWIAAWIPKSIAEGTVRNLLAILTVWLLFRSAAFGFSLWEHPGTRGISWVLWGAARLAIYFMRWITFFVLAAAAIIALKPVSAQYIERVGFLLIVAILIAALLLAAVWLLRRYMKSLPDDPHETIFKKRLKELGVDLLQILMLVLLWIVLLPIARCLPEPFLEELSYFTALLIALGAGAVVIVIAIYLIFFVWLLAVFVQEIIYDRQKYEDAIVLTKSPTGSEKFGREGHGPNKVQNHLISLSYVKNTWWHKLRLRIVLFIVNLICRFWYNRGDLGGIHDIHFLRWIIIDKGRRLLFLDNYHGSWDSYLNAFIDGGAVKGMNAIWSHTYVRRRKKDGSEDKAVGYPRTTCMMWQGARDERSFKEIVRTSQIETLVWYSAYPFLSGINISTNRSIRDALFRNLDTASLDELAQRIR